MGGGLGMRLASRTRGVHFHMSVVTAAKTGVMKGSKDVFHMCWSSEFNGRTPNLTCMKHRILVGGG